jgi:hypothetical protein
LGWALLRTTDYSRGVNPPARFLITVALILAASPPALAQDVPLSQILIGLRGKKGEKRTAEGVSALRIGDTKYARELTLAPQRRY